MARKHAETNKILRALIILILILFVFSLISQNNELDYEADLVIQELSSDSMGLLNGNEVVEEKIEEIEKISYSELKGMLGIKNDFCFYFEDGDGTLVKVNRTFAIGSSEISVGGKPCS